MTQNLDPNEIHQFSKHSSSWWDKSGKFKTLHEMNPVRLKFVQDKVNLNNQKLLDIGCGGGIFTESAAQAGAKVTGIDLSEDLLEVAKLHLYESKLNIDYQHISAEDFASKNQNKYDIITCFELLEHVPDPSSIVKACAKMVKPGGCVFFSTINRTLKAWALAIVAAEHIIKIVPQGSHHYEKLIRPAELHNWCQESNLSVIEKIGIHYNPLLSKFKLHKNLDINYIIYTKS